MLRIYHLDFFISYCLSTKISVSLYQKGWQFSCHLITCRNVKDLSPEMFTSYCFSIEISGSLYQMGWQFSCHLITGRNFKDLSPDNVLTHIVLVR